jgi:hypothetical protein
MDLDGLKIEIEVKEGKLADLNSEIVEYAKK